jgi:hypothetical protein
MKIYKIYLKTLVLFFIFYTGETNSIKNICKQINDNKYIPIIHYAGNCSGSLVKTDSMRLNNPYVVFAKDILRKYVYIFNVVVIYVLLNT